jgi:PhnB protein
MVANPPKDMPRITPYLHYQDVAAAARWLQKVFGFENRFSIPDPKGGVMHAEVSFAEGVVMLGPTSREHGGLSPRDLEGVNQGLYVYVDDVQRHYEHTREAGARITMEPETMFWGDRVYGATDLEGHHWTFAQHVEDVPPEAMKPPGS